MALSNPMKSWPIFKNWPKMSKRLVFRDFIAFAYTNFLYGESKKKGLEAPLFPRTWNLILFNFLLRLTSLTYGGD